jgi:tRNA U34 5-carboxymethylaminomethyl modifying GTPase MnmE/TrmE
MPHAHIYDLFQNKKVQASLARICGHHLPTVVVCGAYSHGKSSLLNSLIGGDVFAVSDGVETRQVQEHQANGICWLDTPGLYADINGHDDAQSLAAIYRADHLLLVHRASIGELDQQELQCFSELLERWPNRCTLVLTAKEELNKGSLERVIHKIKSQIPNVQVTAVSANGYQKGEQQQKHALMAHSNIGSLMSQIDTGLSSALAARPDEKAQLVNSMVCTLDQLIEQRMSQSDMLMAQMKRNCRRYEQGLLSFKTDLLRKFANVQ